MFIRTHLRTLLGLGLLTLFLLHATGTLVIDSLGALERQAYDLRLAATVPGGVDDRIVIADIDERSLEELGHWPWKRHLLADLVNTLFDHYGVRAAGFDIIFSEADGGTSLPLLRALAEGPLKGNAGFKAELRRQTPLLDYDRRFADSLKGHDAVLGFVFAEHQPVARNALPTPLLQVDPALIEALPLIKPRGYVAALPALQEKAAISGFFDNPRVDEDGIFRRVPLLQATSEGLHPSLALAVTWLALDRPDISLDIQQDGDYIALEGINLGGHHIPVDAESNLLVPYRGSSGSYPYISIADILARKVPAEQLRDRIVFIGTSAPGLLDLRTTPLDSVYPGVEVHANIVAGILDGRVLAQPAWTLGVEFLQLLVLGLFMLLVTSRLNPSWQVLSSAVLIALTTIANMAAWDAGYVIPLASSILLVVVLFTYLMSYGYFIESHGKRELTKLFGQYVPPELVDEMASNPEAISLEGQARELTVLFSDVRSFTTISEGLDPRELSALMNAYLTAMTRVIHRHRGTIDKYMGDAIMAFWGAPVHDPEHARHALEAALDMMQELEILRADFRARGWPPVAIGIGLNTGTMSVGNMGSEFRMAYTVMGDAVNLGSRLEGLSKQYGVTVVVSEFTRDAVPDYAYRRLDCVRVKGKDKPVMIYEPLGPQAGIDAATQDNLQQLDTALAHYAAQRWDEAEAVLHALCARDDRKLYHIYLERIAHFRIEPPPADWDGVFTHETK